MSKSIFFMIFKYSIIYGVLKSFTSKTAIYYARLNKHQEIIDLLANSSIQQNET